MMAMLLHCPHLGRDVSGILNRVPDVHVLTGYPVTPGEKGCLEMHQRAVRRAMDVDAPYVAVFEDDCGLTDAFCWDDWITVAQEALASGYGAVHGGSVLAYGPRLAHRWASMAVLEVDRACSAHCMIYTRHGYQAVLDATQPFDLTLAAGTRVLLAWPFVAIQRAGLSGIGTPLEPGASQTFSGPKHVDYEGLFAMHEQHLGMVLGLARRAS